MKDILLILGLILIISCEQKFKLDPNINPFFQDWNTQFEVPPFLDIKNEHYMPAFKKGMEENLKEIDIIVNNSQEPTFENTIEELERSGKLLGKVQRVFSNLASSNTNSQLEELQRDLSPMLSAHYDKIRLNEDLFNRVELIWNDRENLDLSKEQQKLLSDTRKRFVRSGALLSDSEKKQIIEINSKISELTTAFGQNLLAETNGFELILDKSDLDGLSEEVISAAYESATQKMDNAKSDNDKEKYKDKYLFTPHRTSMYPFLTESTRRDLREKLYNSYVMRGDNNNETDNKKIAVQIAKLRVDRANIMGYETHAHYVLEENMLKTPEEVYDLLTQIEVTGQYIGDGVFLKAKRPIFRVNSDNELIQVSFNNYDRAPFKFSEDKTKKFYEAIKEFDLIANNKEYQWRHVLKPGELLIFNNWRILHGRGSFSGERKMSGCYINKEDFDSSCRIHNII